MDSSRRAVESYWRSRMIDAATSDEDKVTPVYKLEEICELLRSSHSGIVKEVSEFILKRLEHKSPVVKQKALRLIKYAVGKSGAEFRREMQRHSIAVRQLFHYKGQPDPLKGDALNKAVRETAQEAISAIFSAEESKPAPAEDLNRRIQGFGNTNYEMLSEDKKSFLSEVVGLGSASIKQGISNFTQSHSLKKNDNGSYRGPNLHRSLTIENDYSDKYDPVKLPNDGRGSYGISKNVTTGPWDQDSKVTNMEIRNGESSSSYSESKTREERLLETIVTTGGVRLQPTRDALQVFLVEAAKLDALALGLAIESKLQSPIWQVRMKAICVLEALVRRKDDEHFATVASYFEENKDTVVRCSESPQNSLQEKANKVLSLLGGNVAVSGPGKSVKAETINVQMPDLIDTGDPDDLYVADDYVKKPTDQITENLSAQGTPFMDDLFGDSMGTAVSSSKPKNEDDPFSDVSFHTGDAKEPVDDIFSGMTIDGKQAVNQAMSKSGPEMFDMFGSNSEALQELEIHKNDVSDFMAGLSINGDAAMPKQNGASQGPLSENFFLDSNSHSSPQVSNDLGGILGSQMAGINANQMFPLVGMPYNLPPGLMLNPAFASQPINYGAMGNLFAQQQLLATMANFQQLGQLNAQDAGSHVLGNNGESTSPFPDIFQSNFPNQTPTSTMNSSKKEETKAFDFISDHLASVRDSKRVM